MDEMSVTIWLCSFLIYSIQEFTSIIFIETHRKILNKHL